MSEETNAQAGARAYVAHRKFRKALSSIAASVIRHGEKQIVAAKLGVRESHVSRMFGKSHMSDKNFIEIIEALDKNSKEYILKAALCFYVDATEEDVESGLINILFRLHEKKIKEDFESLK